MNMDKLQMSNIINSLSALRYFNGSDNNLYTHVLTNANAAIYRLNKVKHLLGNDIIEAIETLRYYEGTNEAEFIYIQINFDYAIQQLKILNNLNTPL